MQRDRQGEIKIIIIMCGRGKLKFTTNLKGNFFSFSSTSIILHLIRLPSNFALTTIPIFLYVLIFFKSSSQSREEKQALLFVSSYLKLIIN